MEALTCSTTVDVQRPRVHDRAGPGTPNFDAIFDQLYGLLQDQSKFAILTTISLDQYTRDSVRQDPSILQATYFNGAALRQMEDG